MKRHNDKTLEFIKTSILKNINSTTMINKIQQKDELLFFYFKENAKYYFSIENNYYLNLLVDSMNNDIALYFSTHIAKWSITGSLSKVSNAENKMKWLESRYINMCKNLLNKKYKLGADISISSIDNNQYINTGDTILGQLIIEEEFRDATRRDELLTILWTNEKYDKDFTINEMKQCIDMVNGPPIDTLLKEYQQINMITEMTPNGKLQIKLQFKDDYNE
jgi:hypothetical protein